MVKKYLPRLWSNLSAEEKIEKLHEENKLLRSNVAALASEIAEVNAKANSALSMLAKLADYEVESKSH